MVLLSLTISLLSVKFVTIGVTDTLFSWIAVSNRFQDVLRKTVWWNTACRREAPSTGAKNNFVSPRLRALFGACPGLESWTLSWPEAKSSRFNCAGALSVQTRRHMIVIESNPESQKSKSNIKKRYCLNVLCHGKINEIKVVLIYVLDYCTIGQGFYFYNLGHKSSTNPSSSNNLM